MLFNSVEFLLFLPAVFLLYWFVFNRSLQKQNIWLLIASYFFYGWWSWEFMLLLMLSTVLDFLYGFGVASENKKRAKFFLWLSVLNNIGILAVFKYYNFFAIQFQKGFALLGLHADPFILDVALPVGISFYTFHGMSYVFDIYRGQRIPVTSMIEYAVFVAFFPLLVAGPIERASHLLPQVQKKRTFQYKQAVEGCRLILWGFFKKVVIADSLAEMADQSFSMYLQHDAATLMVGAIAFSFQIYGDFSGYSDIAIGTAKLFGFELLSNFKFPYFSRDIAEFWRRWHISLSSWFKDYLYIPLGGSKEGKWKAIRNTFIIFVVSGFWHGASWNFIVWGTIHACMFLPLLLQNRNRTHMSEVVAKNRKLPLLKEFMQMSVTFFMVSFAWIFFRAGSMRLAIGYVERMVTDAVHNPGHLLHPWKYLTSQGENYTFLWIFVLLVIDWKMRNNERVFPVFSNVILRRSVYVVLMLIVYLNWGKNNSFIYFQF